MQPDIYKEAKQIIQEVPEIISTDINIQKKSLSQPWYQDLSRDPIGSHIGYIDQLLLSLKRSQQKLTPDNPFLQVKGQYNFFIDTSKGGTEKTEYIHKKVIDYLTEKHNKIFFFKPGDNSKIYVLNEPHSYQVSRMLKDAPKEIQKLVTQYPTTKKSKVTINISTDPLDIVKKSTHQPWTSCETVGGQYCTGIFSDIENNNAIAYIYLDDSIQPTGRFMLRWCEKVDEATGEKKKDIGIEPIMYPRTTYALEIYELIRGIVESKGYGTYDDCKTPYRYEGYSDYIGGSGEITYHSGAGSRVLIQYATLPDISRNLALALAEHTTPTEVRRALAENSKICELEDVMVKLSKDIDSETKRNLIVTCSGLGWDEEQKKLPEKAIENFIYDPDEDVRATAVSRVNLTPEQVRKLSDDKEIYVKLELIRNKAIKCCQDVIDKLALEKGDVQIEAIRRYGEDLSPEAVNTLHDRNEDSALMYVDNLDKYPHVVRKLADDPYVLWRGVVASKEYIKCCSDVIDKLAANDERVAVKLLDNPVAQHKREEIINRLNPLINATSHYQIVPDIARQHDICDYNGLLDNLKTFIDDTTKNNDLYRHHAQENLAKNPAIKCRPDIIKELSHQQYVEPKKLLAGNPAIAASPETIEELWNSDTENKDAYQRALLSNPALESALDLFKKILEDSTYKASYIYMTDRLASNPAVLKRRDLAEEFIQENKSYVVEKNPEVFKHDDLVEQALSDDILLRKIASNRYIVNHPDIVDKLYNIILNWNKPIYGHDASEETLDYFKRGSLTDLGHRLKHSGAYTPEINELKKPGVKVLPSEVLAKYSIKYKEIIDKIEAYIGHPIYT